MISGMLPFFTSALAFVLIGDRPTPGRAAGLGLILLGVGTLFFGGAASSEYGSKTLVGDLILLCAGFIWSMFTVLLKRWQVRAFDVTLGAAPTVDSNLRNSWGLVNPPGGPLWVGSM